jgi:hypothetical protein
VRKNEKQGLVELLKYVRTKFRPNEFDKMTLGDWKEADNDLSKWIVKLEREVGDD